MDTDPLSDIDCPTCGSSFSLALDETITHHSSVPRQIAQFRLIEPLGTGAFGTVWKAEDSELQRTVALKIPRKGRLSAEETEKFIREARAVAQLKHPRIVTVHEVGRHDETVYIVSDLIEGLSLGDFLTGKRMDQREAAELCRKIAEALDHAHQAGVIHRDLKPGNIMLDAGGEPHILDFGLAKREAAEVTMTIDGQVLGTPAYMSPEQARGEGHYADRRSDIYSLGVIFYELLTGERPFRGNARMLLHQVLNDEPTAPRKLDSTIPRDLETICLKCLDKNPDRRYQQAGDLAADLGRWLHHEPISARPLGPLGRTWRWSRRNPALAVMTFIAAVGLVATAAISASFGVYQWQMAQDLAKQQEKTQNALQQTERANTELQTQRNEARTHAQIAEEKEKAAIEALKKAEAAEKLANERLASIRRYLYGADINLAQQALRDPANDSVQRAVSLLNRHGVQAAGDEPLLSFEWAHLSLLASGEKFRYGDTANVTHATYSRDGRLLALAIEHTKEWDGVQYLPASALHEVHIVDGQTGAGMAVLPRHPGRITRLQFTPENQLLEIRVMGQSILGIEQEGTAVVNNPPDNNSSEDTAQAGQVPANQAASEPPAGDAPAPVVPENPVGAIFRLHESVQRLAGDAVNKRFQVHIWNSGNWSECSSLEPMAAAEFDISADGKQFVTLQVGLASQDLFLHVHGQAPAHIWHQDLSQASFAPHYIIPQRVQFSPTGKQVLIGGADNTPAQSIGTLGGMIGGSGDRATGRGYGIQTIDIATKKRMAFFGCGPPSFVCYSPKDTLLAVGELTGVISIWNPETGSLVRSIGPCPSPLSGAFSEDGRYLAVGCQTGHTRVFAARSGQQLREFRSQLQYTVGAVAFSPDGTRLAAGGLWNMSAWDPREDVGITKWELKGGAIGGITIAPDNQTVLVLRKPWLTVPFSLESNMVQLDKFDLQRKVRGRTTRFKKGEFPAAVPFLLLADQDDLVIQLVQQVDVLNASTNQFRFSVPHPTGPSALAPDGRTLTTISANRAHVWKMDSGEQLYVLEGHKNPLTCLAYARQSARLLTGDEDGDVWEWDLTTGQGKFILDGAVRCQALVYSPDEQYVHCAVVDQLFRWSRSRNEVDMITSAPVLVRHLDLSPDGRTLAMISAQAVWLLDPYQGQVRMQLQHPTFGPVGFAFSPDNRVLAVAWQSPLQGIAAEPPEIWFYHTAEPAAAADPQP